MTYTNQTKAKIAVKSATLWHDVLSIAREASAAPAATFKRHYWPIVMPAPITFLSKSMISKVRAQIGTSNVENYRPNSLIHSNSLIHLYLRSFAVSDSLAGNFCTIRSEPPEELE